MGAAFIIACADGVDVYSTNILNRIGYGKLSIFRKVNKVVKINAFKIVKAVYRAVALTIITFPAINGKGITGVVAITFITAIQISIFNIGRTADDDFVVISTAAG